MTGKPSPHILDIFDPLQQTGMDYTGFAPRENVITQTKRSGDEKQPKVKKPLPPKVCTPPTQPNINLSRSLRNPPPNPIQQDVNGIRSILKKSNAGGKEEQKVKKSEAHGKTKRRRKTIDETNDTEEVHADGDGEKKTNTVDNRIESKPIIIETRRGKTICPDSLIQAASSVANSIMRLAQSPNGNPTWDITKEKVRPPSKADEKDQEEKDESVEVPAGSPAQDRRKGKSRRKLLKVGEVDTFANSDNPTVKNAWPLHCAFLAALQECSPRLIPALSANNEAAFLNAMWSCFWRGYRAGFQASVRELEASIAGKNEQTNKKTQANTTTIKETDITEKPASTT